MLNPLLGENLGRWAEVYFTSSPETREQALRDLLLELQAEHSSPTDSGFRETDLVQPQPTVGESVKKPGWPVVRPSRSESIADPRGKNWYSRLARVPHRSYLFAASGFALAGILVLGYTVLDGTPAPAPGAVAQRPSATMNPPVNQPLVPIATAVDTSKRNASVRRPRPSLPDDPGKPVLSPAAELTPAVRETSAPGRGNPAASSREPSMFSESGSEELALGKSYLNGSNGRTRDSAEAAKWLWKAVGKQNAEAEGLLSGLYLKGDGVPKNCDQARLLLDAAARKGVKGAGEQLTHLQAFGCQ